MEVSAYAKINWMLAIEGLRKDGYHELDMVMQPIALCDRLVFEEDDELTLFVDGAASEDPNNLVIRAARALIERTGIRGGARIRLDKHIPARAGLGGGSADCAATLKALNGLWRLNLSDRALYEIGLSLGADVPFCLTGTLARVRGIGEDVEILEYASRVPLVLMRVGEGLSTPAVFKKWDASPAYPKNDPIEAISALRSGDYKRLREVASNALLAPACALMPEIAVWIDRMYAFGAEYAQMSGSGSTIYGVFPNSGFAEYAVGKLGENAILTETLL